MKHFINLLKTALYSLAICVAIGAMTGLALTQTISHTTPGKFRQQTREIHFEKTVSAGENFYRLPEFIPRIIPSFSGN